MPESYTTLRWSGCCWALAFMYRFGPNVDLRFQLISVGNVVTAILIALASIGFRFYVFKFGNYGATYGNLAAMIVLILWIYLVGITVLVGCEIKAILRRDGTSGSAL